MQVIKRIIEFQSREEKTWYLVPLGDIHLGHANCDKDLFQKTIEFIKETPNCLFVGMGDYADAITAKDKRYDPHAIDPEYPTPDLQYRAIEEFLRPIADKCIGLLDGNHDYYHWLKHNHNYVDSLAYNLKVPYLTMDAYIRLVFRRRPNPSGKADSCTFNIYAHHGWTNARTAGYKVLRIHDLAQIFPNLDLYLMGHVHVRGEAPPKVQLYVDKGMNVIHHEERFVFTGGYLRGYMPGAASYIEARGYTPTSLGSPLIKLEVLGARQKGKPKFRITIGEIP